MSALQRSRQPELHILCASPKSPGFSFVGCRPLHILAPVPRGRRKRVTPEATASSPEASRTGFGRIDTPSGCEEEPVRLLRFLAGFSARPLAASATRRSGAGVDLRSEGFDEQRALRCLLQVRVRDRESCFGSGLFSTGRNRAAEIFAGSAVRGRTEGFQGSRRVSASLVSQPP